MKTEFQNEGVNPDLRDSPGPESTDAGIPRPAGANREFVVLVLGTMALLVAALLVLAYFLVRPPPLEAHNAECDEKQAGSCGAGRVCSAGLCIDEEVPACKDGKGCNNGTCQCPGTQSCREDQCVQLTAPSAVCSDPDMKKLVGWIRQKCGGGATSCPNADWDRFALESDTFDGMMAGSGQALSIHFDWSIPRIEPRAPEWPDPTTKSYYLAELQKHRKTLDDAKLIFIVGRASKGGTTEQNHKYGFKRMNVANGLLRGLYAGSSSDLDKLNAKLHYVTLGDLRPLDAGVYRRHFGGRMIGWNAAATAKLAAAVTTSVPKSADDHIWTVNTLNQVALIIPIPCDGTEGP